MTEIAFENNFLEIIKTLCLLFWTDKTWTRQNLDGKIIPQMFASMEKCSTWEKYYVSYLINFILLIFIKYQKAPTSVFLWRNEIKFEIMKWKHYLFLWHQRILLSIMEILRRSTDFSHRSRLTDIYQTYSIVNNVWKLQHKNLGKLQIARMLFGAQDTCLFVAHIGNLLLACFPKTTKTVPFAFLSESMQSLNILCK